MKAHRAAPTKSLNVLLLIVGIVTVAIPFHAFLSVWLASGVGHYLVVRLWKECLLAVALIIAARIVAKDARLRQALRSSRLFQLIAAYVGLTLLAGLISWLTGHVSRKALGYGLLVDLRFLAWFFVVWVLAQQRIWCAKRWPGLIFWPAAIVCAIGLLQFFVLPYDFLKHFGYNAATIFPYETINHNLHYQRIMSTLRGANPLGAYLLVVLALLLATWKQKFAAWRIVFGMAAGLTLFLTFSRAAWLGTALSLAVISLMKLQASRYRNRVYYGLGGAIVLLLLLFAGLRHNAVFQNAVFHTEDKSTVAVSSNQGHSSALRDGLRDVVHEPLGRGPGTAGPASVYNDQKAKTRIAENYYLQIGQETGWLGLGLFSAITVMTLWLLWKARANPLACGLFASGLGLVIVNMLSHAWTDDTLAYIWWGLAAIALTSQVGSHES